MKASPSIPQCTTVTDQLIDMVSFDGDVDLLWVTLLAIKDNMYC